LKTPPHSTKLLIAFAFLGYVVAFDLYLLHLIVYSAAIEWKYGSIVVRPLDVLVAVKNIAKWSCLGSVLVWASMCVGLGGLLGLSLQLVVVGTFVRVVFYLHSFSRLFLRDLNAVLHGKMEGRSVVELSLDTIIVIHPTEPRNVIVGFQDFAHKEIARKIRHLIETGHLPSSSANEILVCLDPREQTRGVVRDRNRFCPIKRQ